MSKHLNALRDDGMLFPMQTSVIADLTQHAAETGQPLPIAPLTIDSIERFLGVAVDLDTGGCLLDIVVDDGVRTLDDRNWLASLEQACGGRVAIAWAMRPEDYFAQIAGGGDADLQPE